MKDLLEFLRAQLDEDKRAAFASAAVFGGGRSWHYERGLDSDYGADHVLHVGDRTVGAAVTSDDDEPFRLDELAHIARHDPARVLAEVDAKRRLLDDVAAYLDGGFEAATDGLAGRVVAYLALPYADRPGYRDEWRPQG